MPIQVTALSVDPELPLPVPAHPGDAGLDLMARIDFSLGPGERAAVGTGLAVEIPVGHAGLVLPRSGLARRHGVTLVNSPGLIDAGYRGEIEVLLVNLGSEAVGFQRGERIAQLVIVPVASVQWVVAESLSPSTRGADGFGSTGR